MVGEIFKTQLEYIIKQNRKGADFEILLLYYFLEDFWFGLMLNVQVNNFSVMLGQSHHFLGITSTFGG